MTIADSKPLDLLGKYVSFEEILTAEQKPFFSEGIFCKGLIEEVSVTLDNKVHIRLVDEFYSLSNIKNLKVLGEVHLFVESPKPLKTLD